MNKIQRVKLKAAADILRNLTSPSGEATASKEAIVAAVEYATTTVGYIRGEEQDKYDNLSEGAQNGTIGEEIIDALEKLEMCLAGLESIDLEDALNELNDIASTLEGI